MNRHPGGEEHTKEMLRRCGWQKGAKILDMGAGDGSAVLRMRRAGILACGIDRLPGDPCVRQGDFLSAPYSDATFDGIISQCAFYSSGDPVKALKESYRLLRCGGLLALSDVCEETLLFQAQDIGFTVLFQEDMTALWRAYYLEAIWRGDAEYVPCGKKLRYYAYILKKPED